MNDVLIDTTIVYLNNFGGPGLGGGEVQLVHMMYGAVGARMDVHLVAQPASGIVEVAREMGVLVTEMEMSAGALPTTIPRLRRMLAELEPEIVQGTGFLTNQIARITAPSASKVISTVHVEPDAPMLDGGSRAGQVIRDLAERATRKRADVQVAVSRAVADKLVAAGAPADSVRVIYNGVDVEALREEASSSTLPEGLPDPEEVPLVSVVARLEPVKGVTDFLRAVALIPEYVAFGRRPLFVVAGEGSQVDEVAALRESLGLVDRVRLLGRIPSAAALLAASEVAVVPSRSEGFGIVAAEAMALGTPVVATEVGGLPEVVEDGVCGRLVEPGDPQEMAEAVGELLNDTSLREVMSETCQHRAAERFSVARMTSAYLTLYAELLA